MRVLVASDALAGLSGLAASEVIAAAFAEAGAQVAVVPLAISGPDLATAVELAAPGTEFVRAGSATEVLAALGGAAAEELVLDLTTTQAPELSALLRHAGDAIDPTAARIVALVPDEEAAAPLTGLNGVAARRGRATGAELAEVLEWERRAERWAQRIELVDAPGAGAVGGLGALVLRAGGQVSDPLTFLARRFGLAETLNRADLAVTGAAALDFHGIGGPIVKRVVALAAGALCPAVAVVGHNFVSTRELRLAGLEAAYAVAPGPDAEADATGLAEAASRVARTWCVRSQPRSARLD